MLGSSVVLKVMRCCTSEVFEEEKINKQPDKSGSGTASLCDITEWHRLFFFFVDQAEEVEDGLFSMPRS